MRSAILCMLIVLAAAGAVCAQDLGWYRMMRRDCPALRTVRNLLALDEDQAKQAGELAGLYREEVRAEVEKVQAELNERLEKARAALDEKFTLEVVGMLTDEQKKQFDELMAAEQAYAEAMSAANEEYRSTLRELFYGDKDDKEKERAQRMMMRLPKEETDLFHLYSMADDDFRMKFVSVRSRHATAIGKIHSGARKIDRKDPAALKKWQKEKAELLKEEGERYRRETLELLNEEQSKLFDQAVEAMKKWQEATKAAETAYIEAAKQIVGPGKNIQIKSHLRSMSVQFR